MEIIVRLMVPKDLPELSMIDHSYETEYVWQMELETGEKRINATFTEVRLPRPMTVSYPRDNNHLIENQNNFSVVLVAEVDKQLAGYITSVIEPSWQIAVVPDLVVSKAYRRKEVGTSLIQGLQAWGRQNNIGQLQIEMQSKNYPASQLVNKLGYEFCGYSDRYYPNRDITLFFSKRL